MDEHLTLLKRLLVERHWQTYRTFAREYVRAAMHLDPGLAHAVPSEKQFRRWINGKLVGLPYPVHREVLAVMFPTHTIEQLFAPGPTPCVTGSGRVMLDAPGEERATDRRDALRLGGALTAGYLLDPVRADVHTEPERLRATLAAGSAGADQLARLERTATELGARVVRAIPPSALAPEVLAECRTVRVLLEHRQRTADQLRLIRVAAMLAMAMGNIMFDENDYPACARWHEIARQAALEAGDQYLADMALGLRAYLPAYSGDPHGVLALLEPRLDQATVAPTSATAFLWASVARAHATLGETIAFRHAMNRAGQALDASPPEDRRHSVFTFLPGKLAFYQATGCARLGDPAGATEAADRALRHYDLTITGDPALIRLDQATALATAGELPEAAQVASAALLGQYTYPGSSVLARAREFDMLLGPARTPAVKDWREILATVSRPATTPPT